MTRLRSTLSAVAAAAALGFSAAASAAPVAFTVKAEDFYGASGYGFNIFDFVSQTQLEVAFNLTDNGSKSFSLDVGQSYSWTFGSVSLSETNIATGETDNLGVTAQFDFNAPVNSDQQVVTAGQAVTGTVNGDSAVDFSIDWQPLTVSFNGGTFQISLNDLSFTGTGSKDQTVTITLLSNTTGSSNVPEPASLALVGGALALMGAVRRRRQA